MTSERLEIRITGFGGQGVILSGHILGSAAAVYEGRFAALAQTYGPEARGGARRADVIIADDPIDYPQVHRPQILIALSQDGYAQQRPHVDPRGLILIDEELVRPEALAALELPPIAHASAPATRLAQEIGHKIMANIVMVGFTVAVTGIISREAAEKAIAASVPKGTEAKNLKAFEAGWNHGRKWLDAPRDNGHSQPQSLFLAQSR